MKSFSFNDFADDGFVLPATSFLYMDMGAPAPDHAKELKQAEISAERAREKATPPGLSMQEVEELVSRVRAEAVTETESRLRGGYEARAAKEAAKISEAIELFHAEQSSYFSRIESEVVHLALAIAAKILHREAQVDQQLVAALVHIAVDKLHDGSSVSVRVSPERAGKWREYLAGSHNGSTITIIEDAQVNQDDCILETDLGSANFSIEAQLKEVESGFFDLLAQRPPIK